MRKTLGGLLFAVFLSSEAFCSGSDIDVLREEANFLSSEIDKFSAGVGKLKQRLFENTRFDNYSEIMVDLSNIDNASVRKILIRVDRFTIYSLDTGSDILPNTIENILAYSGPMQAGKHTIRAELKFDDTNTGIYKDLVKEFEINIPNNKKTQRINIVFGKSVELGIKEE